MGKQKIGEKVMHSADLQEETLPVTPLIEIAGDRRVLIEHHKGVTQYGCDNICVKVKFGQICICGKDLQLSRMTKDQLIISGQVNSVQIIRGC